MYSTVCIYFRLAPSGLLNQSLGAAFGVKRWVLSVTYGIPSLLREARYVS